MLKLNIRVKNQRSRPFIKTKAGVINNFLGSENEIGDITVFGSHPALLTNFENQDNFKILIN